MAGACDPCSPSSAILRRCDGNSVGDQRPRPATMLASMTDEELKRLAKETGIPLKKIAEWHFVHARDGMPRKQRRPKGTLSINDIMERGIPYQTIHAWRQAGLKTRQKGRMV